MAKKFYEIDPSRTESARHNKQPLLELKTRPRFCPDSLCLSVLDIEVE
jgi:hypothetical protein